MSEKTAAGRTREVAGVSVPNFIYGTAWKEERTHGLVKEALRAGFRGIDTANQRRHYHEAEVGRAVQEALDGGLLSRDEIFLQTKFTFRPGQDHRLPYDPAASIADQVAQSFESSLSHLGVQTLDSYLLHGPTQRWGLSGADVEAWEAMEKLYQAGRVRCLGVSNFSAEQLSALLNRAGVRPSFVQNRCFAALGWDGDVRAVCDAENVAYQAFSLLTANLDFLGTAMMADIARRHKRTIAQVTFRFAIHAGMIPITGTSDRRHMRDDLAVCDFELMPQEVRAIETLGAAN